MSLLDFNLLRLVLVILTCYRLARMIAMDDGPGFFFERLRLWAKEKAEKEKSNLGKWHNLSEGLGCPFCAGAWVSLPLFVLLVWPTIYGDMFLLLLSISGAQAFMQSLDAKR